MFWVIAANAVRVFLIVYAFTNWGVALDTGWRHDSVGVLTFLLALGMSLSTDQLLQFVVPALNADPVDDGEQDVQEGTIQRLISGLHAFLNRPRFSEKWSMRVVVGVLMFLLSPLAAVSAARFVHNMGDPVFAGNLTQRMTHELAMPEQLGPWTLQNVERLSRVEDDPLGLNSVIYTYTGGALTVQFSVDGYYRAWHDLAYCYNAVGWQVQDQNNVLDNDTGHHTTILTLHTKDGQNGLSFFSCFDSQLKPVRPARRTLGTNLPLSAELDILSERLPWTKSGQRNRHQAVPPVIQLQLLCSSQNRFLTTEETRLQNLFRQLSEHVLESLERSDK